MKTLCQVNFLIIAILIPLQASAKQLTLDEKPAVEGEWGYRPAQGMESAVNPPSFSWRPQKGLQWEIECARDTNFRQVEYRAKDIEYSVHCPPKVFRPGRYSWRYRGKDGKGQYTNWSKPRTFIIPADAVRMPMPTRKELIQRIPKTHPRLFLRPENVSKLKQLARGPLKKEYEGLVRECEKILKRPPDTKEPPRYPKGMERKSEEWRKMWWGNRTYTKQALNGAATLAFTRMLGGPEKYGQKARQILLECAKWDPKGSTGYRYNDEAGMPYNYYFARTYTYVNDLLTAQEKDLCRKVMKIRGEEMYNHLCPRHLWRPYSSHSNRAWHFLGEVGIAFLGEIPEAEKWGCFAMDVFFNAYPVWSDDDGGWHEGVSYWSSYQGRFTWWADVMREALGINAYEKPFFSQAGYYALYLMPPGKVGGGFGDLTARRTARSNRSLMSVYASQAHNGHWQWYVDQIGGSQKTGGYIGFIRGALSKVDATPPADLPTSRLFAGTGQAYLNSDLFDATKSTQVVFKASPFGTQSHGYEANNSFLLWGYGKRLLIRSGYRDIYGSKHHVNWMWSSRSTNCITVNGQGQGKRTAKARGEIIGFETTPSMDVVIGEAGSAYEKGILDRFTRTIIYVKPELVSVFERRIAKEDATFEYWLHAIKEIEVNGQHQILVRNDDVLCDIDFLTPAGLTFTQTDQYDPNPRERIKLREWHLTAKTAGKQKQMEFVTLYRPHRANDILPKQSRLEKIPGGYALSVKLSDGKLKALLPTKDQVTLSGLGMQTKGAIRVELKREGKGVETMAVKY